MSFSKIIAKTLPYIFLRILVAFVIILLFITYAGLCLLIVNAVGAITGDASIFPGVTGLILFFGALGIWRFLKSYLLYMVKAGHVAVVTELVINGDLPTGKGQLAFGKEAVATNFMTSNVMWVLDNLILKAVKEIRLKIDKAAEWLSFIPGAKVVGMILNIFVGVLLNSSDEAVFAHIFKEKSGNTWKSAADGIVLYAQNWREIMKSAFVVTLVLLGTLSIVVMGGYGALLGSEAVGANTGVILIIIALTVLFVKWALVDQVVMIFMVRRYLLVTNNQQPAIDVYETVKNWSGKFRELLSKGNVQAPANPAPQSQPTAGVTNGPNGSIS